MATDQSTPATGPTARLTAAVDATWRAIRTRHTELPDAWATFPGAGRGSGPDKLAHYDAATGQLGIHPDSAGLDAEKVLGTILHAAGHALAHGRGVADTSRQGRYHNQRYRDLATELGLDPGEDGARGWADTTVPAALIERYATEVEQLRAALMALPKQAKPVRPPSRNLAVAQCECPRPRNIRVAPSVLDLGPIECDLCEKPFTMRA